MTPSVLKILILAGAQKSGKTTTIGRSKEKGIKAHLTHEFGRTLFSYKGKKVAVWSGSCQELNEFCHFEGVIECIKERIKEAEEADCALLILPFTLWTRWGELNTKCITEPLDWLRSKGHKVKLVYLRNGAEKDVALMDGLMDRLGAEVIERGRSSKPQTEALWRIFLKFDP